MAEKARAGRQVRPSEVLAIFGRRGSGKTTLARSLVARQRRLIVFDPIAEWCRSPGITTCESVEAVRLALRRRWRLGFRLALPCQADHAAELDRLARLIWGAQEPFLRRECPELVLVVDELNLGMPLGRRAEAMLGLTLQGRHRGIGLVGISQRPALVSSDFRGQAHRTFWCCLSAANDLRTARETLGDRAAELRQLGVGQFLEDDGREVTRSATPGRNALKSAGLTRR